MYSRIENNLILNLFKIKSARSRLETLNKYSIINIIKEHEQETMLLHKSQAKEVSFANSNLVVRCKYVTNTGNKQAARTYDKSSIHLLNIQYRIHQTFQSTEALKGEKNTSIKINYKINLC